MKNKVPLPYDYRYLKREYSPRILREMLKLYGTKEVKGAGNNPVILKWAEEIRPYVGIEYKHDSIAWCGLVMGVAAMRARFEPPKICVRAKEWLKFGWDSPRPELGNILVFERKGGGHVGLYVGEDEEYYHVLGGNQSDEVNIRKMAKHRLIGARECPWRWMKPWGVRPIILDTYAQISHNEA